MIGRRIYFRSSGQRLADNGTDADYTISVSVILFQQPVPRTENVFK